MILLKKKQKKISSVIPKLMIPKLKNISATITKKTIRIYQFQKTAKSRTKKNQMSPTLRQKKQNSTPLKKMKQKTGFRISDIVSHTAVQQEYRIVRTR